MQFKTSPQPRERDFKWIKIVEVGKTLSGKTSVFNVIEKGYNTTIATIKWHPNWRKYAFYPESESFYEVTCLEDITIFLRELEEERKNGR